MLKILALLVASSALAFAQPVAQEYVPPDQELWGQMSQAIANISMPAAAHQQVQQILQNVEREAAARAARKKAADEAAKTPSPK